jgi:hypothetical protein
VKAVLAVQIVVALSVAGAVIAPSAWQSLQLRWSVDDPAALADLQLNAGALTTESVEAELAAAVVTEDHDLAHSFIALADAHGVPVSAAQRARVTALEKAVPERAARDFAGGFITGETGSLSGLAGAVTGDMVGYGDLRDLWREGQKRARGEQADELVIGLAAVGLAITAGTWATIGSALPARGGITVVKAARTTGRLSKPLAASLTRMTADVVDKSAVRKALSAAGRLDLGEARMAVQSAVRPGAAGRLKALSNDAAAVYARTGHRGAMQTLALAENADEVGRAARLAAAQGPKTRAILKTLGRGALVLGAALSAVVSWTFAGLAWMVAVALVARRLGLWLGRKIWGCPPNSPLTTAAVLAPKPLSSSKAIGGTIGGMHPT